VLRIRNAGTGVRRLRTFSYAEFGYVDSLSDQQNLDWSQHIVTSRLEGSAILASTRFARRPRSSPRASPVRLTGDREAFVGRCRDLGLARRGRDRRATNAGSPRGNSIGSLCHDVSLGPGEERRLVFMLGLTDHPEEIGAVSRAIATRPRSRGPSTSSEPTGAHTWGASPSRRRTPR